VFPYQTVLGNSFHELHPTLQQFHGRETMQTAEGVFEVCGGLGLLARLFAFVMRMPKAGREVPVHLCVKRSTRGETWTRIFGDREFVTRQSSDAEMLRESFSGISLLFAVSVSEGNLEMASRSTRLLGIPMIPKPRVTASESATDDGWNVVVDVSMWGIGRIIHYRGHMVLQ